MMQNVQDPNYLNTQYIPQNVQPSQVYVPQNQNPIQSFQQPNQQVTQQTAQPQGNPSLPVVLNLTIQNTNTNEQKQQQQQQQQQQVSAVTIVPRVQAHLHELSRL